MFKWTSLWLCLTLLTGVVFGGRKASSVVCVDDHGRKADWFIVYKFPNLKDTNEAEDELFTGQRYATISSNSPHNWTLSPNSIRDESNSILARTLAPLYNKANHRTVSTKFYNDQPPGDEASVGSKFAHAKGVVATTKSAGFWLIHTVPRFPSPTKYEYVHTGLRFGQVAMCVSLKRKQLEQWFYLAKVAKPYIYHTHGPWHSDTKLGASKRNTRLGSKQRIDLNLTTVDGVRLRSFYKSRDDQVDLYADIVAPALRSSLLVETWRKNPGGPLNSECSRKLEVENVEQVAVRFDNSKLTGEFSYLNDHSKWAISERDSQVNAVCVGDINRVRSQSHRGGGTTCLSIPSVWKAFREFVGKVEKCH